MKAEEKYEKLISEFDKKYLYELVFIPIVFGIFFYLEFGTNETISEQSRRALFLACFGGVHILSSRMLSFLYNLSWVIFPVAIKTTYKGLRILGAILVVIAAFI